MSTKLDSACLVVNFRALKGWKQTSTNREASDSVTQQSGAVRDSATVQVKLFRNEVTEAINALFTSTRRELHNITLPTQNDSQTLVPVAQWERVNDMLASAQSELGKLCAKLPAVYQQFVDNEKLRLGSLFESRNYATVAQIVNNTKFEYSFETLPDTSRFSQLFTAESIVVELSAQYESKLAKVAELAKAHLAERVESAIDKIVSPVRAFHSGKQSKLMASKIVKSCKAELAICAGLNFDNDTNVCSTIDKVLQSLPSNPEQLLLQPFAESFCNGLRPIVQPVQAPAVVPVQAPTVQAPAELPPVASAFPSLSELPSIEELETPAEQPTTAELATILELPENEVQAIIEKLEPVEAFAKAYLNQTADCEDIATRNSEPVAIAPVQAPAVVPVFVPMSIDDFE